MSANSCICRCQSFDMSLNKKHAHVSAQNAARAAPELACCPP